MRFTIILAAGFLAMALPSAARAQFVGGGASAFEPEIDVVESGIKLDAQATVSADRKYVTLTMRPQNAQLLNLFQFTFQQPGPLINGPVGGVNPVLPGPAARRINAPARVAPGQGGNILLARGVTPLIIE